MRSLYILWKVLVTLSCWIVAVWVVFYGAPLSYEYIQLVDQAQTNQQAIIQTIIAFSILGLSWIGLVVFGLLPAIIFGWPYPGEVKNPP